MKDIIEAIILGVVQGLTEFLPISSSGHLEIMKFLLQDNSVGQQSLLMTVVLHFATAISTIIVFRKEVYSIFRKAIAFEVNESTIFILKIIISMIPAACVGFFWEDALEAMFNQRLVLVGGALLVTAVLLVLADRPKPSHQEVSYKNAFWIGIAQAIAIIPGLSRSGATISTAVLLKIDRDQAARFSFLMVVPLIFGKMAKDLISGDIILDSQSLPIGAGFIAALITGIFACVWMVKLVRLAKLRYFGLYCILAGIFSLIVGIISS